MRVSKIPHITILPVVVLAFVIFKAIDSIGDIKIFFDLMVRVMNPFIWGFVIAYLANPLMKWIESKMNIRRGFSILIVYLIIIGLVIGLIAIIMPNIIRSLTEIISKIPAYIEILEQYFYNVSDLLYENYNFDLIANLGFTDFEENIADITEIINTTLMSFLFGILETSSRVFKFITGLIISIYMLMEKELFKDSLKKTTYALSTRKRAEAIFDFGRECDEVFSKYIIGKLLDSFIIGIIAFIGFNIIHVPYAMLMAIIIGVTNMIPYFGPFIGGIPVTIIAFFSSPITALWTGLFILGLQQFDGNILGPKIIGDSVGLSPFWIILAIIVGGGLFGIIGMLIGVPVLTIVRNQIWKYLNRRLEEKEKIEEHALL